MADRPGLAGLDDDMMGRIERGLLTQAEAARLLGVSKQALGNGLKRRRARAATAPAPEVDGTTPDPVGRPAEPQQSLAIAAPDDEAEKWAQAGGQAWRGLAHAYVAVVVEARDQVVAGRGKIGATTMNGLVRALRESEEGLRRLGLLPAIAGGESNANDKPAELKITVLGRAEEAEIRAEIAERAAEEMGDVHEAAEPTPPSAPRQPAPLIDQLPEPDLFEQWIAAQVHLKGAAWLRQVVIALGGQALHGKDQLASELMRVTRGDPQKLRPLVRVST